MDRDRFFGGNPIAVILRLAVISVVVGIVLSALDIKPQTLVYHVRRLVENIYALGFGAFESILGYLLLGGVVVVPIWLAARLIGSFRRDGGGRPR
jgi:hypothetical protein